MFSLSSPLHKTDSTQTILAVLLLFLMTATILTALGFQYIGHFIPCKLCLEERIAYYVSIPLLAVCFLISYMRWPAVLIRLLFIFIIAVMFYNFYLSIYHVGVEYKFWQGPSDCSASQFTINTNTATLLSNINNSRPVSCSDAPFYFLGLSMAGMNAFVSLFYMIVAFLGAFLSKK